MEQPPHGTNIKLSEYLTRQFGKAHTAVTGGVSTMTNIVLTGYSQIFGRAQIYLNGRIGNRIDMGAAGSGAPTTTTISTGTKIILFPQISVALTDYALGIEASGLWFGVPSAGEYFRWYGGTSLAASLSGSGHLTLIGDITAPNITRLENMPIGGMRKTTVQAIGALGAAYVPISSYQADSFTTQRKVSVNLASGAMSVAEAANYVLYFNMEATFTRDINSQRSFNVRVYNNTDSVAIANALLVQQVGAYQGGSSFSVVVPLTIPAGTVGKALIMQVGGGSTFALFDVNHASFTLIAVP